MARLTPIHANNGRPYKNRDLLANLVPRFDSRESNFSRSRIAVQISLRMLYVRAQVRHLLKNKVLDGVWRSNLIVLHHEASSFTYIIDLLMGLFRGAVFQHGWGARKQPIKQPTEMPTSTMALMGRFASLMGRFPALMGRFPDFVLRGRFTSWKCSGKQPIKKRGIKRFLDIYIYIYIYATGFICGPPKRVSRVHLRPPMGSFAAPPFWNLFL